MTNKTRFQDIFHMAIQSLKTHKGRSLLTILGIVIGISSIMIIMSIGDSATQLIIKEIQSFGSENVFINPGKPSSGPFSFESFLLKSLTEKDLESLQKKYNVPDAVVVNPSVNTSVSVSYGSDVKTVNVTGTGAQAFSVYNLSIEEGGRAFTEDEIRDMADVAVIGKNVVDDLFHLQNPIGEKIKIKNKKLRVIGVFSSVGSSMFGIDDLVFIPYTTMQRDILGIKYFQEIVIQAKSSDVVPNMVKDIKYILRENHNIEDPSKDDFIVSTQEDIIKSVDDILSAITVFLMFVAGISLLVGGIGIMNIMFVSVTERTREIGLRKSLGATNKDILTQFLLEATLLTSFGGIIGVVFGALFTLLITVVASYFTHSHFGYFFSIIGSLLGILVACGTGIVFGIFPARQAAKKSPIEALRYE